VRTGYAIHRPVANTFLVRTRDRGRRLRDLFLVLSLVVPLGTGLLAYTWVHLEVLDTGYRINELEHELRELNRVERQRRLEAAYRASPEQVERRATDELGMRPPTLEQTIFWGELR
jgi:hypothetical protein